METMLSHVMLSRIQFAVTAMFHIIWPVLTVGLSLFLFIMEALWLKTKDEMYHRHCHFWSRLFILNFTVGVVTGIPLEFQFGTNWSPFAVAGGDFFGHMLGFEAAMAFMLEATFLGIMVFGWHRVSPAMHLFATAMVALGSSLSAFWIMVTNSWMHTPTGGVFENGKFVIRSHMEAIFNPDMPWGVSHMWMACLETTVFAVGGLSAWYLLKGRHMEFFLRSFKIAVLAALVITPLQAYLGHGSGWAVFTHQPTKLAAIEAHWNTNPPGTGATWNILAWPDEEKGENRWALTVPYALSLVTTNSLTGQVRGLNDFPRENRPPVALPFYSFRLMMAIGFLLVAVMLRTVWLWRRGQLVPHRITRHKALLTAWILALPLNYIAMEAGWVTREVGRQPWIIYGLMRTDHSATTVPPGTVAVSLLTFTVLYTAMLVLFLIFARRIIRRGPDVEEGTHKRLM